METTGDLLERMRDPLGAPFFPEALRALLVVTWVLHIFFVTLALGASVCTIVGFVKGGEYYVRLARATARAVPSAVGFGIVTGIAPLLFIQTIYDPAWYAANALTGFWSVVFVFVVMGAYGSAYLFYMRGSKDGRLLWSAVLATVLLCFAGFIMHVLASVSIRPGSWMSWYAPDGVADTRGVVFHSFNIPRLTFLLPLQAALSAAVGGLLYVWYMAKRPDADVTYLRWVGAISRRLGMVVSVLYAVAGFFWALTEGRELDVLVPTLPILVGVGFAMFMYFTLIRDPLRAGRRSLAVWFASLLAVAVTRELIRTEALSRFGYEVASYPYSVNWGSTMLFLATTVVGSCVLIYMGLVLYQSAQQVDSATVSVRVDRFGRVSLILLSCWFAFFLALGLYTVIRTH